VENLGMKEKEKPQVPEKRWREGFFISFGNKAFEGLGRKRGVTRGEGQDWKRRS